MKDSPIPRTGRTQNRPRRRLTGLFAPGAELIDGNEKGGDFVTPVAGPFVALAPTRRLGAVAQDEPPLLLAAAQEAQLLASTHLGQVSTAAASNAPGYVLCDVRVGLRWASVRWFERHGGWAAGNVLGAVTPAHRKLRGRVGNKRRDGDQEGAIEIRPRSHRSIVLTQDSGTPEARWSAIDARILWARRWGCIGPTLKCSRTVGGGHLGRWVARAGVGRRAFRGPAQNARRSHPR